MKLSVGILGNAEGWSLLLAQEGVPFSEVTSPPSPHDFSVVVAADGVQHRDLELLKSYLVAGGAALCSAKTYAQLTSLPIHYGTIPCLSTIQSPQWGAVGILRLRKHFFLSPPQFCGQKNFTQFLPQQYSFGKGIVLVLPFDAGTLVCTTDSGDYSFYSPYRRLPFEHVATVSKHTVRRLISSALELLHHKRNLPYVHLWYFPSAARSIFSLRIDTDGASSEQIKHLYVFLHRHHLRASWFLDLETQETLLPIYKTFEGDDIGVHCYQHQRWQDEAGFRADLEKAVALLRKNSLHPKGFAAPYGRWCPFFPSLLRANGFEYSSEFSYDYDNLPSITRDGMMQVPIHPICIGSMKRHSYTDAMMMGYFDSVVIQKLAVAEPLIFYHHPRDGRENVLEHLLTHCMQQKVPLFTMSDFASWWKVRTSAHLECRADETGVYIDAQARRSDVLCHVTLPSGTETFVEGTSFLPFTHPSFRQKAAPYIHPPDTLRICRFNYRIPLIRSVDAVSQCFRKVWEQ